MSITNLTRSAVHGQHGMVCSDSPLAAAAGLRVLQNGGNAFDAALAVAAVETVTIVPMCGLGGDSFILAYDADSGKVTNINSSGVAGSGAEADYYRNQGLALMPIQGPHSVTVPGEAAAWEAMHRNFCTMPMPDLLAPAIGYAENGFPVPARIARVFANNAELLARFTATADIYLANNGRPPREGEVLANPDLANTIRRVAAGRRRCLLPQRLDRPTGRRPQPGHHRRRPLHRSRLRRPSRRRLRTHQRYLPTAHRLSDPPAVPGFPAPGDAQHR